MTCPRCHHANPGQAKFCLECGVRLAVTCSQCRSELPPSAKFCLECGAAVAAVSPEIPSPESYTPKHLAEKILTSKGALEGERKQVTVLFADLKGSMELLADRDPEEARTILDPVLERMMDAVHHYEGAVNQVMGDGIMALFGAPLAHEDHAVRACYAALRMQEGVRHYSDELRRGQGVEVQIRVGVNSGDVVVRSIGSDLRMDYTAVGQTTHLAARMEQLAAPGSIRLTAETLHLAEGFVQVAPLGPVPVKGLAEPIEVFELVGAGAARTRLEAAARRGLTRFVGRNAELEQLRGAINRTSEGHGQVVAVVGEPGLGKSRLFRELLHSHSVHGWLIVQSGSVSYGKTTAYLPVIELLRGYFAIESRDDPRKIREKITGKVLTLAPELGPVVPAILALLDVPVDEASWHTLDPPRRRQQTLDALKRLFLRESEARPLMVVFEDLHWIDGETQALLDSLVEGLPAAHLLLLVNYRPEYQHGWGGKTYYRQLRIDPLPAESADELLDALLGPDPALGPLKRLLVERTEANPLFLEESVRALVETAALAGERGAYRLTRSVENLKIPATVQAILAARIDHLAHTLYWGLLDLGRAHLRRGDLQRAPRVLERGLELCRTWQFVVGTSLFAATLGAAYALAGRADEALPLVEGAVEEFRRRELHSRPALILLCAGTTSLSAGRIDEAAGHAREALALTRRLGARGSEAHALCLAGDVASTGHVEDAEGYYRGALARAGELGMRPLVAHCHLGVGKLSQRTGKSEQAREHLTTATAMYREMDMRFYLEQAEMSALA